jgi:hypothetical protein
MMGTVSDCQGKCFGVERLDRSPAALVEKKKRVGRKMKEGESRKEREIALTVSKK